VTERAANALILYDAECRFCRWSLAWILRWDRRRTLEPVALQDPRARRVLAELDPERRMASWHLVDEQGEIVSAGAAGAPLLRALPGGAPLARILDLAPGAVEAAYARVAGARGTLGRRLTDRAVSRADELIAQRQAAPEASPLP
jgi:predicted DCC family thiol-disulfide oxidoreductase YuxK